MKKACYLILMNIILLMNIQTVHAQFLPSNKPTEELNIELKPFNLPSSWWKDAFLDKKKAVFEQRKKDYLDNLKIEISKFSNNSELNSRQEFVRELFDKYHERFYLDKPNSKPVLLVEGTVTEINLILDLNAQKRLHKSTIVTLTNSNLALDESIKLRSSYINQLKINYPTLITSDQEKLLLELDWLQAKLTNELELISLNDQIALIEIERKNLKNINYRTTPSVSI